MGTKLILRKLIHLIILPLLLLFYYIDPIIGIGLALTILIYFLFWEYIPIVKILVLILKKDNENFLVGPIFMVLTALVLMLFPYTYAIVYALSSLSFGDFIEIILRKKGIKLSPFVTAILVGLVSTILSINPLFGIYTFIVFLGIDLWGKITLIDDNILHFLMVLFLIFLKM